MSGRYQKSDRGTARRRGILLGGAALSLAAALLHALALAEHLREWWGYGMFFLIVALVQALYGAALLRRPGQVCYLLGIGGHLTIVALYLVTRTIGIPLVGPHAGVVHEAGALDLATALIELTLVGALVALTRGPAQLKVGVLLGVAQASFAGLVLQRPGVLADHDMNSVLHWLVGAALAVPFAIVGTLAGNALARRIISRRRQGVGTADTVAERLIWALITAALSAPAGTLAKQVHLRIVAIPRMDTHGAGGIHVRRVVDTPPPVGPPLAWGIVPDIAAALGAALVLLLVFAAVRGLPWESAPRRRWRPRVVAFSQASTRIALAASVAASLLPAQFLASLTPLGRSFAPDTAAAAITCGVTRSYSVAAINVTIPYNRWGDTDPNGMIYVLQADKDAVKNWDVPLNHVRTDQGTYAPGADPAGGRRLRPRPLVLRANVGDCVSVAFTNELQPRQWGGELMNPRASIHVHGPSYDVQTSDGGAIGFNDDTTIAIGESITYLWQAPSQEGLYFFHDHASPAGSEADGGSNVHGLFGALAVEPADSSWFDPISGARLDGASPYLDPVIRAQSGDLYLDAEIRSPAGTFRESVQLAQDEIPGIGFGFNYGAEPQQNREANRCPDCIGEETSLSSWVYGDPALVKLASGLGPWPPKKPDSTPASYSWTVDAAAPGAEPTCSTDMPPPTTGIDTAIVCAPKSPTNSGSASFTYSATVANAIFECTIDGKPWQECAADGITYAGLGDGAHTFQVRATAPSEDCGLIGTIAGVVSCFTSNVFHAYAGDATKIRYGMSGVKETHVFHLHAHQWRSEPADTKSPIIDSQTFGPGEMFTADLIAGAGSAPSTFGDSIFHCHLYPHFADGMWSLFRVHDVREDGSGKTPDQVNVRTLRPLAANAPPAPTADNPGFPRFIPGTFGWRAPQPPNGVSSNGPTGTLAPRIVAGSKVATNEFGYTALEEQVRLKNYAAGAAPQAGAPFRDPCPATARQVTYNVSVIQRDIVYNEAGWHDTQGRLLVLDKDVGAVLAGTKDPEPLFIRVNAGDCINFNLTNRVPNWFGGDAFLQLQQTNMMGGHIHLVKFDVLGSDGSSNGWNYQQAAFSKQQAAFNDGVLAGTQSCTEAICRIPDSAGAAYTPEGSQDFPGQTIRERWYADTELKTVFTHDHHFPAVDQNRGQFGALIVEPAGVDYRDPRSGTFFLPGTRCGASCEGDAAGWMMDIIGPGPNDDFREFGLAFQDFVSLTRAGGDPRNPADTFNPPAEPELFPDDDPGIMGINYRNAPFLLRDTKNGAPVDPAYRFSSTVFGDPKTPLLQAYAGDPVRIRVIQGSQEEQHAFTLHGMRWRDDPDDPNSPLVNTKTIGISEAFSMQIPRMECGVDEDCRGDYLYSGAATDDLYLGMWGIFRVYGKGVNGLLPLPDNVPQAVNGNTNFGVTGSPPPKANKPGTPCPANATVRKYNVVALQAKLTYNEKGDNDPYGLLYALAREGETPDQTIERVQQAAQHEPLTLRANEGDCVEVTLTNKLTDAFLAHAGAADGDAPLPLEPPVGTRAGLRVSLHPQLVLYDVRYSDGATVGFNRDQTVGPGETITYRWHADDVSPGELGATNLTDYGDVRGHRHHGLFAGLNIEPKNATYHDPHTGAQIESGTTADIRVPGMKDFREFTLYFQDGLNLRDSGGAIIADPSAHPGVDEALDAEDGGEKGFNYTNAPFLHRLGSVPVQASVTSPLDGQALARVFSSKAYGDPKTPIFRAYTGDPVRMRVLQGADKPRQHAFQQNGHAWKPQPDDPNSVPIGTQGGFTVARALNIELPAAGGGGAAAGDYRYACGVYFHHQSGGLWGLMRVYAPPAAKPVFKPTPLKATDNPRDVGYFPLMPLEQAEVTARVFDDGNMDGARGNSEVAAPKVKFNLRDTAGVVLDTRETTAEVQAIVTTGTGGTFALGYGASTTAPLAYNATAAQVEQALNALTAAKIKVSVSGVGTTADPWIARFHQPTADQVALLTADDANLTGGTTRVVTRTGQVTFQVARGAYDVEAVPPPDTSKPGGSDWALTSPATFRADATAENARADGGDFGMVQLANATIRVFDDRDGSQFLELGEANLVGWTVTLTGSGQTRTATTDANGLASFDGLKPGTYTADAAAQAGWLATRKMPVTVLLAEDESLRPHATDLTLGRDVRLGYALKAGLSVKFFNDSNKNGVQDPGESNLASWQAIASGGPPELPVTVSVETNVDGIATFDDPDPLVDGLRPGTYTLSTQLKPDWSYNSAKATTTLKDDTKQGPVDLSMGSGGYTTTLYKETTQVVAVGLHNPNSWIAVAPFNDVNNDGVRQDKESKLTGGQWIATLHQTADGPAIATSPTGNGGLATFYPVPPGTYVVKMVPPPPSSDPTVPDWTATTKTQVTITVIAGETGVTRLGFIQLGTLQALVVFDFNRDGVWDGNEQPLANRNVRLYDKVGKTVVAYGATDAQGRIAFKASPGVGYQLEVLLPDGWTATAPLGPSGAPVTTVKLTGPSSTTSVETLFGQYSATGEAPAPDATPPTVVDMAPGNGETNVPVTSSIVATFSESMDPTTVNSTTFKLLPVGSNTAVPATVDYDGTIRQATLKPSTSLATNASYTVVVDGATDTARNPVVKPTWSFQTAPPDTTAPTVTVVAPSDGASQVLVTTNLTATFSEPLDPTSVTDLTFTLEQVAADKSVTAVPALVSYDGPTMQATLKPKSALLLSATYRATVKGGAAGVKDAVGTPLAADYRWSFSTVSDTTPPPAPTATPAGGTYASAQSVTLTSEAGATFRYTLDGTTPSATVGTSYSGPILIAQTATLKAVASDAAGNTSPVTTESYTISTAVTTETVTVAATAWTTTAGTRVSGSVADLATDEGVYLAINAAKVGKKYRVDGYGSYSVPAAQRNLVDLKIDYDGRASVAGVSRTLYLYNFTTGTWETLQTVTQTGTTDLRTTITVTGDPLRFLSATGEIRLRVENGYNTAYQQDADLMTFTLTYKP